MKYIVTILTIILFYCPISVSAIEWANTYGLDGGWPQEQARSVQQTKDGGYIVAGKTYSLDIGTYCVWVLKLDESGNVSWQKVYGEKNDRGSDFPSIKQTADGGYIVACSKASLDVTGNETITYIWVLKLDESGNVVWQKLYGGQNRFYPSHIQLTTDGGYVIAGSSYNFDIMPSYFVLKLDESGNVSWLKTYGAKGGGDRAHGDPTSIQQTTDGGYIVACSELIDNVSGDIDMWVLKLDESGNVVWQKLYGGQDTDYATSIQQTTDGGYIVAGATVSTGAGIWDMLLIKLDESGNVLWNKTYGRKNWDYHTFVQQTTDGGYIVVGNTDQGDELFRSHIWLLKLDSSGNISWEKSFGKIGVGYDEGFCVQQTTDGGYIVAGGTMSYGIGVGAWDMWILKLDSNGAIPGCSIIMHPSNSIIMEHSLSVKDTDVMPQPSSVTIIPIEFSSQSTSAMITSPCCNTWPDVKAQFYEFMQKRATFEDVIKCYLDFWHNRID